MSIIRASVRGDLALVKKCISEGASVDSADSSGRTALIEAAWGGFGPIVDLLLEKGASINAADSSGFTALMRAVEEGHGTIIEKLLKKGADVNTRGNVRGSTPLMLAAEQGDIKIVELLLGNGAKLNAVDQFEETALARAYHAEKLDIINLLESHGATRKPERSLFTQHDKDLRPFTKASVPKWSAAADDASFEEEEPVAEESFEEE